MRHKDVWSGWTNVVPVKEAVRGLDNGNTDMCTRANLVKNSTRRAGQSCIGCLLRLVMT